MGSTGNSSRRPTAAGSSCIFLPAGAIHSRGRTPAPGGALVVALLLLGGALAAPLPAREAPPDLSGVWKLDLELSDDPAAKLDEALQEGRGGKTDRPAVGALPDAAVGGDDEGASPRAGGGFRDSTGAGGSGPPSGRREKADPKQLRTMQQRLRFLRQRVALMEIRHADPSFAVAYIDGRQRAFQTDGKKSVVGAEGSETEIKARWKGRQLVVTTHAGDSESTESYELSPDGQELRVTVKTGAGAAGPISFTFVYHPTTLEQELPPPAPPAAPTPTPPGL